MPARTFVPPPALASAARAGLRARAASPPSQRGMTPVGLARARQLAARRPLSERTVRRMKAYFDRHAIDKRGATWSARGKGWQAWNGWGGDAGRAWANRIIGQLDKERR